jgi:CBS domain-containing protein
MKIKDIMSKNPSFVLADDTLQTAARKMAELDCGFLPVGENDKLVGTVTDRDIAIRAVARGLNAESKVREAMSRGVLYCTENDTAEQIAQNMAENAVRRLVVLDNKKDKRLVGVVALGDIATAKHIADSTTANLIKALSIPNASNKNTRVA